MSILHVNQIASKIKDLFADKIDLSDIRPTDQERETKILTRCLAAYAIYNSLGCSRTDAASSIVDGGDDNGIDALYYSPASRQMLMVQSKWIKSGIGEPDSGEIGKFCRGVRDLFNMDFDRFNHKVLNKQTTIEHALAEYETRYSIILIDTGDRGLAIHAQRQIDDLLHEMNDAGEGITDQLVQFDRMNQGKIHSSLALSAGNLPINFEVGLSQWGKVNEPHGAFYGMVAGEEVAKWWSDNGRRLFDRNLRQVLGKTDVNDEIKSTLNNSPDKFWYYNNGITIVASKIDKSMVGGTTRDIGSFKLTGASIVNGAQTVSTIGAYLQEGGTGLEKVKVQVRIISLSDTPESFGAEVTRTNNRQNRIENRDFVSQDLEQIRIKTELAIDGIDYNIVRSDSFKPSEKSFDLQEATVALACCSGHSNLAVQAKREIGKFFEDLSKGIYKAVFNPETTGAYVYNCVNIIRSVDTIMADKITDLPKKSGRFYGLLVHGNRIITLIAVNKLGLDQELKRQDFKIDIEKLRSVTENTIQIVFDFIEKEYSDNMLGTLFKNATKCKDIVQNCV